jgi:hypothetical protein
VSIALLVTVDLAVRHGQEIERRRSVHALCETGVAVCASDAAGVTTSHLAPAEWPGALTEACDVVVPPATPAPYDSPDLPWELVVGSGAALTGHRPGVYDELVARADDRVRTQLRRLHLGTVGRLRAVCATGGGRRIGWVSWVLVADGWRALTPYAASGRPMVRLEPRRPDDLAAQVARWAAVAR